MTQPAKGQEPSMEEILASIRRIIADDPAKTPQNDGLRSDSVQSGGTRIVGGRDSPRKALQNQPFCDPPPRLDPLVMRIAQDDAVEDESALGQPQPVLSQPSRISPETQPPATLVRSSPAAVASPAPEGRMQQEEIEAFQAELGSSSSEAWDALDGSTAAMASPEVLPDVEFAASDHVAEPTAEDEEEEQSATEPEQELQRPVASQPRPAPPPLPEQPAYAQRPYEPEAAEDALISAHTTAAVNSAFNTLAQTVLVQNGRTLEDLVREMLRPMLKVWLDDNLPGMVERLVRAEIERVSRGRG